MRHVLVVLAVIIVIIGVLEANTKDTTAGHVLFHYAGHIHAQATTMHLSFMVDLRPFSQHCAFLERQVDSLRPSHCQRRANETVRALRSQVASWPNMFDRNLADRHKRQLVTALLGTVLGFTLGGSLSQLFGTSPSNVETEVHQMARQLDVLQRSLVMRMQEITHAVDDIYEREACVEVHGIAQNAATIFARVAGALHLLVAAQRVSPVLLPLAELRRHHHQLLRTINMAKVQGHMLDLHAVYELPASYICKDHVLKIVIHVPVVEASFKLFVRESFPLETPQGAMAVIQPDSNNIGVAERSSQHGVISDAALARCTQINGHHFCTTLPVLNDFTKTCAGALFYGSPQSVTRRCALAPFREGAAVIPLQQDQLRVFVEETEQARIVCPDQTANIITLAKGFSTITLAAQCVLVAQSFQSNQRLHLTEALGTIAIVDWQAMEDKLHPISKLSSHLDTFNAEASLLETHSPWITWAATAVTITIAVAAGVLVVCLYRRYRVLTSAISAAPNSKATAPVTD